MTDGKKYRIIKAEPLQPTRDLLEIRDKHTDLVVSVFGPNTYNENVTAMQKTYFNSKEYPSITFKEPTTSESIFITSSIFEDIAKPKILDTRWLQLGRIVRTSEGVYVNPPRDEKGNVLIDEDELRVLRDEATKLNRIYLGDNDFGFAPYETFDQGRQDWSVFLKGGLSRVLEYTSGKKAKGFAKMAPFYKRGVNVFGFYKVREPIVRVASLSFDRDLGSGRLDVGGSWDDSDCGSGCAFGVHSSPGEASA